MRDEERYGKEFNISTCVLRGYDLPLAADVSRIMASMHAASVVPLPRYRPTTIEIVRAAWRPSWLELGAAAAILGSCAAWILF